MVGKTGSALVDRAVLLIQLSADGWGCTPSLLVWPEVTQPSSLKALHACLFAKSLQLCPTLCNPMDCSLPGSSVHGILQVRLLEWVAISSSRGSSQPRDPTHIFYVSLIGGRPLYH